MANQSNSFGIFSGTGSSGASGVTSVTAGTGLTATPNPITATGTIELASTNGLITRLQSVTGSSASLLSTGPVPIYEPNVFPNGRLTLTQQGRATISTQNAGAGTTQLGRIGAGGLSMYDQIEFSAEIFTTCNSGILALAPASNGIFQGKLSVTGGTIACNGTNQTATASVTTFRVGDLGIAPTSATTDYMQVTYATSASSGLIGYNSMDLKITQFSD